MNCRSIIKYVGLLIFNLFFAYVSFSCFAPCYLYILGAINTVISLIIIEDIK